MEQFSEKLSELLKQKAQFQQRKHHLKSVDQEIQFQKKKLKELGDKINRNEIEIEELEIGNIEKLLKKILGFEDERLENQKKEIIWLYLNHKKLSRLIELLEYEKKVILKSLNEEKNFDLELELLLESRLSAYSKTLKYIVESTPSI